VRVMDDRRSGIRRREVLRRLAGAGCTATLPALGNGAQLTGSNQVVNAPPEPAGLGSALPLDPGCLARSSV
jgi:hypothetical protein